MVQKHEVLAMESHRDTCHHDIDQQESEEESVIPKRPLVRNVCFHSDIVQWVPDTGNR